MKAKIIIAAHKPYRMPEDSIYLPLHVGKKGKEDIGFAGDDTGDNISEKNPRYCELTGLYWAIKNLDADYIGLAHYRRHFSIKPQKDKFKAVLSGEQLESLFESTDVVLPKKQNYYIENLYDHYAHTHKEEHLLALREVLEQKSPEYLCEFDLLKKRTSAHMFNMFIMKRELAESYASWMFDILFELEKRIDFAKMSSFEERMMGRLSELMLDMWINKNKISYKEIPCIYMEKINLAAKVIGFLKAKFLGRSYDKSF
ncbi:MAG: DUF4422 domain-containing protein [Oscillospiraceae bacterium]|nr:DUF4422 domain-containing protein [Oscillospiraceae bacterium]